MTPTDVAEQVATELARTVTAADAGRRVALAVPGGSVADLVFPRFARLAVDWSTGRRHVGGRTRRAAGSSRFERARRAAPLARPARRAGATNHRAAIFPRRRPHGGRLAGGADRRARRTAAARRRVAGSRPRRTRRVDLPRHPSLDREDVWVIGVHDAPKPPSDRVTLTRATLAQCVRAVGRRVRP